MIHTRIAKLKFMAEEMQLALHLSRNLTDPFVARMLARHILIRAENFIEHARALRKPLKDAAYETRGFHKTKESYASAFEEYFKIARHKLGAHVQDFDFGKRIELWNEIEIVKVSFFVEGAQEIYQSLAALNVPGYVPYAALPELTDPVVLETLRQFQCTIDNRSGVELGADPLAMARNNTVALLNMTPIHARAGQLALIRRWIDIQRDLLVRFVVYPQIARILKARVITDLVSFCDCLVTRPLPPGALQEMDGLDKLIVASGGSPAPIDNFVAVSNFQTELQVSRSVRDTIGAHLEIDDARPIDSLLTDIDSYDFSSGLRFYERISAVFTKTCHSIHFLRMYAADGQRMYGVTAGQAPALAYANNSVVEPPDRPEAPPINDEAAYRHNLARWLDGDDAQKAEVRQFFWQAFAHSEPVEMIGEVENYDPGWRRSTHEFRKAHQFLYSMLSEGISDVEFRGVIDLILSCSNGWPYPLAEILVRYGENASELRRLSVCYALGEIGSAPHASMSTFLEVHARSQHWSVRLQAALARFKTFVKAEGLFRVNHRGQSKVDYNSIVVPLTTRMSEPERLICLLAFASILCSPRIGSFAQPFQENYSALQSEIEALCLPYLKDDDTKSKATTLNQLSQTNDYLGVCILVAIDLDNGDQHPLYSALMDSCCNGSIVAAGHDQALRHLAVCFLMKKEYRQAYEIAEELASRNPDETGTQIFLAEILGDTPGAEEEATLKISNIRHTYTLTCELDKRLTAVQAVIAERNASR